MASETKLNPCPVCGKVPKVIFSDLAFGPKCTIRCKPLFRKAHMCVYNCAASPEWAYEKSVAEWNRRALPPRKRLKNCWTCKFAHGERVAPGYPIIVLCKQRYANLPKNDLEFTDMVHHDEVCPLWEEYDGEMPVIEIIGGDREAMERMLAIAREEIRARKHEHTT